MADALSTVDPSATPPHTRNSSQRRDCRALPGLLNTAAIDQQAARVAFGKGEVFSPKVKTVEALDVLDVRRIQFDHPDYKNRNGLRRGRLVALGFWNSSKSASKRKHAKAVFAMRCDCGRFAFRRIDDWCKEMHRPDACAVCAIKAGVAGQVASASWSRSEDRAALRAQRPEKKGRLKTQNWMKLAAAGFTKAERNLVADYRLPHSDLLWLRGAIDELKSKGARHG